MLARNTRTGLDRGTCYTVTLLAPEIGLWPTQCCMQQHNVSPKYSHWFGQRYMLYSTLVAPEIGLWSTQCCMLQKQS
ncbi:hypothetical protein RRG08_036956 [Elysia crispata]|uniref:Uncharacterized protein n=1 Tax=Elysia crispata TaxID=231223 RepID=A0AAE1D6H9_9GAST|nr:hypothetical protein RRG08_036956 [Elysia crispata]